MKQDLRKTLPAALKNRLSLILSFLFLGSVYADNGFIDYRMGNYNQAAVNLNKTNNDPVTLYYQGKMRLYGYGQLKNDTSALYAFEQSADKGYLPAQQFMARYSLSKKNLVDALYWFKKAADKNDIDAQMYCAAAYRFGVGTKKNIDLARRYYILAAKNGNSIAQYSLAEHFLESRQTKTLALTWLNKAVMQNNPAAQTLLADLYVNGKMVELNLLEAKKLLTTAINQGYMPAFVKMGDLALKENDYQQAKDWYTKASNAGFIKAEIELAHLYANPKTPFYNLQTAFLWMLKAAQNGSYEAETEVANYYKNGTGVEKDLALASSWEQKANALSKNTDKEVQQNAAGWLSNEKIIALNTLYPLKGILTEWQNADSLKESNYTPAPQTALIMRESIFKPKFVVMSPNDIAISEYYDAISTALKGTKQETLTFPRYSLEPQIAASSQVPTIGNNVQPLMKHLEGRAILGDPTAQFALAQMYQNGIGMKKDITQAIKFYELGSAQQDLRAEYNLGLIYLEGDGVPADFDKGIGLLRGAAFKGNDYAQYVLAVIDEIGFKNTQGELINKPDLNQAQAMYALAADNDYGPAQYRLAEILSQQKSESMSVADQEKRADVIKKLYTSAAASGVEQAKLPLAFFNAMDPDVNKQNEAFKVAEKEAKNGNEIASLLLGLLYDRGISVSHSDSNAIYWYEKAGNNPVSTFILGTYYSQGDKVSKDLPKAATLLQQAANAQFSYANLNLAIIKQQLGESFLEELEKAIALGNSSAGLLLADYYLSQADDLEKMKQAKEIYQHFAERGDQNGQVKYGYMLELGLGGPVDIMNAENWYRQAAVQGQPIGQYLLAHLYHTGQIGTAPDYEEAKKWYGQAEARNQLAAINIGFIKETIDEDYSSARESYQRAASAHDPIALYNLGLIYEKGKGQAVDFEKAKNLYQEAAEIGHVQAMLQLAGLYFNGQLGGRNETEALNWYKKAAGLGDRDALYQLGLLSETGVSLDLNLEEALHYYQQSAEKGNAKAMLALARMYQYGLGVPQDLKISEKYYQQLSDEENGYAQYQLATFLIEGVNGKKLPAQGKMLLMKAKANGNLQARKALQWLDAQAQGRLSYVEPISIVETGMPEQPVNLMYLDALNDWNRGDETGSRALLEKIMQQFPNYIPAKRAYDQIKGKDMVKLTGASSA